MNETDIELAGENTVPLTMVEQGRKVKLVTIRSGRGLRSRLAELGLIPGVELEIIANSLDGPFILGVKGSRVVIGRGMALKIDVL